MAFKVPYDSQGNLIGTYRAMRGGSAGPGIVLEDNNPFWAEMQLLDINWGHWRWESHEGRKYQMFDTEMKELLLRATLVKGRTENLEWIIRKRGTVHGLGLYIPKD